MSGKSDRRRTVPHVLKIIRDAEDPLLIEYSENLLASMFASPLLFFGCLANLAIRLVLSAEPPAAAFIDSAFFLLLAAFAEIISRAGIRERLFTHLISAVYAGFFLFMILRFYVRIGPSVLTIGFIEVVFALSRSNRIMLWYIVAAHAGGIGWLMAWWGDHVYRTGTRYYLVQAGIYAVLFLAAFLVLKRIRSQHERASALLAEALRSKEESVSLYEEIAATEEELRAQNETLIRSNESIRRNEERLHQLTHFDTLTGLPNRKMLLDRLQLLIHFDRGRMDRFCVVFIDIDRFKQINDTMGHSIGDELIRRSADVLRLNVHPNDMVGRIGGDEFSILIQRSMSDEDVFEYIERLRVQLTETQQVGNTEVKTSASFGISVYPTDGLTEQELMRCADTAMYKAKSLGRNNIQFFRPEMKDEILSRIELEKKLEYAIQNEEFRLEYQPQHNASDRGIRCFEALIRWQSPTDGLIPPSDFIPFAEETGLIIPLGQWTFETVCRTVSRLSREHGDFPGVSVNISPVQMKDADFLDSVRITITETGVDPTMIEMEITESTFIENIDETVHLLDELKKLGIRIALDDFGTGYSSLSYLRQLPLDTLKIDKSFVSDLLDEHGEAQMIGDMISLAHRLRLNVVAEGVEEMSQFEYLQAHGCDVIQGFLLGRPMPLHALESMMAARR